MSMGKRVRERQPEMWVATTNFPTAASHPFYAQLNQRLAEDYLDDFVEGQHSLKKANPGVRTVA